MSNFGPTVDELVAPYRTTSGILITHNYTTGTTTLRTPFATIILSAELRRVVGGVRRFYTIEQRCAEDPTWYTYEHVTAATVRQALDDLATYRPR